MAARTIRTSISRNIFTVINSTVLALLSLTCIFPILHVLAISLSSNQAAMAGTVVLWPVDLTMAAYKYLIIKKDFFASVYISVWRVAVGLVVNMLLIAITAYPLSKTRLDFRRRNVYAVYIAATMVIGGGLIPPYMVIRALGLLTNFWVLLLPGAVNIWSVIIMMNFMRSSIPPAIVEAAAVDGAGHWRTLFQVVLPMCAPSLASLGLFTMITHWNSWFDGMFYMNTPGKYPMATYLATQIMSRNQNLTNMTPEQLAQLMLLSERTVRSAQLFISIVPILIVYPFLQRFFVKGMVVGSVKG
jgi:putative aldouronate transport system permease protein